jgi:hypothetical protein
MNRWRVRLAELHGDVFVPSAHVQNVQMVQKSPSPLAFEHFEQIEQVPETADDTWSDAEEERAARVEYDGGAPRAWAEALARLDPNKPPQHVPLHRWLRFIDDCGRFLDGGWADKAAALGWGPLDLFGCNPRRHYTFPRGLLWEVNGDRLSALHRDGAIIEIKGGDHRTYRREPVFGRVLVAWELP